MRATAICFSVCASCRILKPSTVDTQYTHNTTYTAINSNQQQTANDTLPKPHLSGVARAFESHSWGTSWMPATAAAGRRWSAARKDTVCWLDMSDGFRSCPPRRRPSHWSLAGDGGVRWRGDRRAHSDDGATNSTSELERER